MIENPRKILSEAGYKVEKSQVNVWQLCDKEFTTKSKFNNSIFEKRNTKIEKVSQNV